MPASQPPQHATSALEGREASRNWTWLIVPAIGLYIALGIILSGLFLPAPAAAVHATTASVGTTAVPPILTETNADQHVVFSDDWDVPKVRADVRHSENEAVYILPVSALAIADEKKRRTKAKRLSPIGYQMGPCWDYKGDRVAYVDKSDLFRTNRIVVLDLYRGMRTTYSFPCNGHSIARRISWNKAGTRIACQHDERTCLLDLATQRIIEVCTLDAEDLALSPDGLWIACGTRDGGDPNDEDGWRLNIVEVNTGNVEKVGTTGDGRAALFTYHWAPDSSFVVFESFDCSAGRRTDYHMCRYWIGRGSVERCDDIRYEDVYHQNYQSWRASGPIGIASP